MESVVKLLIIIDVLSFSDKGSCIDSLVLDFISRVDGHLGLDDVSVASAGYMQVDGWVVDFHDTWGVVLVSS